MERARSVRLGGALCCALQLGCASRHGGARVVDNGPVCSDALRLLLRTSANQPANSQAIRRFALTLEGKQCLVSAYLDEVATIDRFVPDQLHRLSAGRDEAWLLLWLPDNTWRRAAAVNHPRAPHRRCCRCRCCPDHHGGTGFHPAEGLRDQRMKNEERGSGGPWACRVGDPAPPRGRWAENRTADLRILRLRLPWRCRAFPTFVVRFVRECRF